jgi:hypothetical protein
MQKVEKDYTYGAEVAQFGGPAVCGCSSATVDRRSASYPDFLGLPF